MSNSLRIDGKVELKAPGGFHMNDKQNLKINGTDMYVSHAPNGDMFRGTMTNLNTSNGFRVEGTYYRFDGTTYVGKFNEKNYFYHGVLVFSDGTKYTGDFSHDNDKNDIYEGTGVYTGVYNDIMFTYEGTFKNNMCHGYGVLTIIPDNVTITGHFVNNQFNGIMTIQTANTTTSAVYLLGKQMSHPIGKFVPVDDTGLSDTGDFIKGDYIVEDGTVYSGVWDGFQMHTGTVSKNGKIVSVFLFGKETLV